MGRGGERFVVVEPADVNTGFQLDRFTGLDLTLFTVWFDLLSGYRGARVGCLRSGGVGVQIS